MNVYYHPASELEFCLRIYYTFFGGKKHFVRQAGQYRVDCVIIPDTTEVIAVRIMILK